MSKGIVFIAFGLEYDMLAAHTVAVSRQFVTVPITVLTNLKERSAKWEDSPDVNFIYLDMDTNDNRRVKIELHKYTPYDETLYIDCDAIIQRSGIEAVFDHLKGADIVFQHHTLWTPDRKYYRIYRDTAKQLGATLPLRVCLGGFWAFRKTDAVANFFDIWLGHWEAMGMGRDMPALACAIKESGIKHALVYKSQDKLFSFGINKETVAVHRVGRDDLMLYGIPEYKQNKPFDQGKREHWDMVAYA